MANIKNIVLYSKNLPPKHFGGIETSAYFLAKELLAEHQFNLHILTQRRSIFPKKQQLWENNGEIVCAETIHRRACKNRRKVLNAIAQSEFDPQETLIYHNTFDLHPYYAQLRDMGYRQIARSGGNDLFFYKRNSPEERRHFLQDLNKLDAILANSDFSLERTRALSLNTQISVLKGGCNISETPLVNHAKQKDFTIISCCRLVDFKGLEHALAAMALLKQTGLPFRYRIVGEGPLRESLEAQIREQKLQDCCELVGKKRLESMAREYRDADIYLSSSLDVKRENYLHTETMGRSICEAQGHGLPVVATDAGGSPEMLVHGKTGLVVQQGNAQAIADALAKLMQSPSDLSRYASEAHKLASRHFSWEKVGQETKAIIAQL